MCVFLILLFILYTCLGMDPQCSKFHYEEQLLEKMIRMELKFEKLQDDYKKLFTDYQMAIVTVKEVMDEVKTERKHMRDEFEKLNNTTTITIEEHLSKSKEQYQHNERLIARISEDLKGMQTNITESVVTPKVGFKATGLKSNNPTIGATLVFLTVLFNFHGGYDPSTGVFMAPFSGMYLFTTQMCSAGGSDVNVDIIVNEKPLGHGQTGDRTWAECNTADAMGYMDRGQTAYIKVIVLSGSLYQTPDRYVSSFSGSLLNKDKSYF